MTWIFAPPIALLIYCALIGIMVAGGRWLAHKPPSDAAHRSLYASGEAAPAQGDRSVPGYRPFFRMALFFAVLHLGVVVLATSPPSAIAAVYLIGLLSVLAALIVA